MIIVKSRSVFLKNSCSLACPKKDLNKNFSFPDVTPYLYCHPCQYTFFNYQPVATRDQSVDLDHPPLQINCIGPPSQPSLIQVGLG